MSFHAEEGDSKNNAQRNHHDTCLLFGQMLLALCVVSYKEWCVPCIMEICIYGSVSICCLQDPCIRARVARKCLDYLHVKDPLIGQIISK